MKSWLYGVAGLGVALVAVSLSALSSMHTYRSIGEMQQEQQLLARQIDELKSGAARGFATRGNHANRPAPPPVDSGPRAARFDELEDFDEEPTYEEPPWAEETAAMGGELSPAMRESMGGLLQTYDQLDANQRRKALSDLVIFARWGDPEALDTIVHALRDTDPKVRSRSVNIIGKLRDDELVRHLEPLLDDPEPKVRKELGKTIDRLSGLYAEPMLVALLDDPDPDIVTDAIERLGSGRYRGSRGAVATLVESGDIEWIAAAGVTLRKLGDEEGAAQATSRIAELLSSSNAADRRWAIRRIGRIRGKNAIESVEKARGDPDPKVRKEAEKTLKRLRKAK
jgi:hypothetical protein